MFILRDLLTPLQQDFSTTSQGKKRSIWFIYTLLAVVVPFTSSITSNLLRALQTLFGFTIEQQRFYTFMASNNIALKSIVADDVEFNSQPLDGGSPTGGARRFH
jgi:hypothetical protein